MDIRSVFASQGYSNAALKPSGEAATADPIASIGKAAASFEETLRSAETTATSSLVTPTDPHDLVYALTQAELAVDTAVNIRNKLVEAYTEILRMPV